MVGSGEAMRTEERVDEAPDRHLTGLQLNAWIIWLRRLHPG
jgi:hypothetical protein